MRIPGDYDGPPPPCPTCGSTALRCKRPSEHEAAAWHVAREDLLAQLCGCAELCRPWLARRGKLSTRS